MCGLLQIKSISYVLIVIQMLYELQYYMNTGIYEYVWRINILDVEILPLNRGYMNTRMICYSDLAAAVMTSYYLSTEYRVTPSSLCLDT